MISCNGQKPLSTKLKSFLTMKRIECRFWRKNANYRKNQFVLYNGRPTVMKCFRQLPFLERMNCIIQTSSPDLFHCSFVQK